MVGVDMTKADLTEAQLRLAKMDMVDFSHAKLVNADILDSDLGGPNMSHADLTEAILDGVKLMNADLRHADLTRAALYKVILNGTCMDGAILYCTSLKNVQWYRGSAYDVDFQYVSRKGAFFRGVDTTDADLPDGFFNPPLDPAQYTCGFGWRLGSDGLLILDCTHGFPESLNPKEYRDRIKSITFEPGSYYERGTFRHLSSLETVDMTNLDLSYKTDFAGVKRLEGCPPLERYGSDLDDLDNRTAARLIDGLIRWKGIYG